MPFREFGGYYIKSHICLLLTRAALLRDLIPLLLRPACLSLSLLGAEDHGL